MKFNRSYEQDMRLIRSVLWQFFRFLIFIALIVTTLIILLAAQIIGPINLSKERARDSVRGITRYVIPESAKLVYGKKHWLQDRAPATACAVFKLSKSDFVSFLENDFLKEREPLQESLINGRGCHQFRKRIGSKRLSAFKEVARGGRLDSYSLYIDEKGRTLMFEMLIY